MAKSRQINPSIQRIEILKMKKEENQEETEEQQEPTEETESNQELENLIEEDSTPIYPQFQSRPINPSLERTEIIRQPLEIELKDTPTDSETESLNKQYGTQDDYTQTSAYKSDSKYESGTNDGYPETIKPTRVSHSTSSLQQSQSSTGYPGTQEQNKNYKSSLEQQSRERKEKERRMM